MTTVEVPYSIAAALPSLSVMDITNDVAREVAESDVNSGIVYLDPLTGAVQAGGFPLSILHGGITIDGM